MHPREYERLRKASGLPREPEHRGAIGPSTPSKARPQSQRAPPEPVETTFALLPPKTAAAAVGLSLPAFWKQVRGARLPAPLYPSPRSPRWVLAELREALLKTRCLPSNAMAARRPGAAHINAEIEEGREVKGQDWHADASLRPQPQRDLALPEEPVIIPGQTK